MEISQENILDQIKEILEKKHQTELIYINCIRKLIDLKGGKNKLKEYLDQRLETMEITYIRHAQSEYNEWKSKHFWNIGIFYGNKQENYDPKITELGISQCKNLVEKIKKSVDSQELPFEVVYISPLQRAILTFENIQQIIKVQQNQIFVCNLIREGLDTPCDVGRNPQNVVKDIQRMNGQQLYLNLEDEFYWDSEQIGDRKMCNGVKYKKESKKGIQIRLGLFFLLLTFKQDNRICIVGHQQIQKTITGQSVENCSLQKFNKNDLINYIMKTVEQIKE